MPLTVEPHTVNTVWLVVFTRNFIFIKDAKKSSNSHSSFDFFGGEGRCCFSWTVSLESRISLAVSLQFFSSVSFEFLVSFQEKESKSSNSMRIQWRHSIGAVCIKLSSKSKELKVAKRNWECEFKSIQIVDFKTAGKRRSGGDNEIEFSVSHLVHQIHRIFS